MDMRSAAVLFDLDGTLVDTTEIEHLRSRRRWKECVNSLSMTECFPGVHGALRQLRQEKIKIGIVTTSVSFYAKAVCKYHDIYCDTLVCYHDAKPKPAPDPFLLAVMRLGVDKDSSLGVGDAISDAIALREAGIKSAGAGWSPSLFRDVQWSIILKSPADVLRTVSHSDE